MAMIKHMHFGFERDGLRTAHYLLDSEAPVIITEFKKSSPEGIYTHHGPF